MRKRWIYDGARAIPVEEYEGAPSADHHIIPDIAPFRSPDGALITGRAQWREHLKRTDSIEMGRSDVKVAQENWGKRKEAFRDRLRESAKAVANYTETHTEMCPINRTALNVEMANRLHGRPEPARKELIKLTLDQAKRMSKRG